MSINYISLQTEITNDPTNLGYSGKSDLDKATILNTANSGYISFNPLLPLTSLGIWAAKTGVRASVEKAALDNTSPVQSPCLAIRDLLVTMGGPPFDIGNVDNRTMISGLVATSIMTLTQANDLISLGNKSPCSRAEVLFGVGTIISEQDIGIARNGH